MSVATVESRLTRRSLMAKTKDELAGMVLEACDRQSKDFAFGASAMKALILKRLWGRVQREEYGHAKAAVCLDIEAVHGVQASFPRSFEEADSLWEEIGRYYTSTSGKPRNVIDSDKEIR